MDATQFSDVFSMIVCPRSRLQYLAICFFTASACKSPRLLGDTALRLRPTRR